MTKTKSILLLVAALVGIGLIRSVVSAPGSAPAVVAAPIKTMEFADPTRVDQMARLLDQTRTLPAKAYAMLPDETTLTESRLIQVLAYLQSVRPTDGGDGPTGAKRMGALIKEAAHQYRDYLSRRLAEVARHP